jgi:hypothetical protein
MRTASHKPIPDSFINASLLFSSTWQFRGKSQRWNLASLDTMTTNLPLFRQDTFIFLHPSQIFSMIKAAIFGYTHLAS